MNDAAEILKSGAADKIADLIHKLAGPMAEEFGMAFGDKARAYRISNAIKTATKTEKLLRRAGLQANAVPARLFLLIMEACSVEDNETLQEMWAGLLATASQETDGMSPAFVETLKQLTPNEARAFQRMYEASRREPQPSPYHYPFPHGGFSCIQWFVSEGLADIFFDTYERLGLIRREYELTGHWDEDAAARELNSDYIFTSYAISFLRACQGPGAGNSDGGTAESKTD